LTFRGTEPPTIIVCSESPGGMLAWFALIHARRASPAASLNIIPGVDVGTIGK
jgi:acetyl esterase/lipase